MFCLSRHSDKLCSYQRSSPFFGPATSFMEDIFPVDPGVGMVWWMIQVHYMGPVVLFLLLLYQFHPQIIRAHPEVRALL